MSIATTITIALIAIPVDRARPAIEGFGRGRVQPVSLQLCQRRTVAAVGSVTKPSTEAQRAVRLSKTSQAKRRAPHRDTADRETGSADCGRFDANHVDRAATPFQCRRGPSLLASRGTAGYRPGHHEPCSLVL